MKNKDINVLDPKEVWETLEQLGLYTHYLASKAIAFWDDYDRSNYRSLQLKAGKIKKVYGIYDILVTQDDVYDVDTPPNRFYETREKAKKALEELISQGKFKKEDIHILSLYKAK